jgi:hypothetical protein
VVSREEVGVAEVGQRASHAAAVAEAFVDASRLGKRLSGLVQGAVVQLGLAEVELAVGFVDRVAEGLREF